MALSPRDLGAVLAVVQSWLRTDNVRSLLKGADGRDGKDGSDAEAGVDVLTRDGLKHVTQFEFGGDLKTNVRGKRAMVAVKAAAGKQIIPLQTTHTHPELGGGGPHNHDADYAPVSHTHAHTHTEYANAVHEHPHTHDTTHNHDGVYAPVHTHPYADAEHYHNAYMATADHTEAVHTAMAGLATQAELDAHAATAHGGSHPDLAAHDTLGLATQAELDNHAAAADPHTGYLKESDVQGVAGASAFGDTAAAGTAATAARTDHRHSREANPVTAHEAATDPHTGYVREADPNWVDLTDGGATTLHSHAGGGASAETYSVLTATQVNSTLTGAVVTGLTQAGIATGTYLFKYWVVYRSAATTTGLEMWVNFTGTVSRLVSTWYTLTTGGAAATGVADQATTATAQMMEGKGQRANNVASGPMQGVDTAAADQFAVVEGVIIVTAVGDIQLLFRTEVSGSAVTMMEGTSLTLTKVA